ncbi:FAD-dependent oxidoreductase [Nitrosopumilus sp.]|uniref:phytoene desaturase family protein n=1 Tax=Nitrosopumilus sp. TaxID=2024843 RepID=UPI002635283D|nr:FAD-dependent oxidoreductase [Nitrosopumilus sp.]
MKEVVIIGAGVSGLSTGALLSNEGISVKIFEKSSKVGGRTTSMAYRNHILDNGFHIMPFYKTSAVYQVLEKIGITSRLKLALVSDISFFKDKKFFKYPKGIADILKLSIVPFSSRIKLLRILAPMAFSSMKKAEELDDKSLTEITNKLDSNTKSFFDAVCMLAFADTPEHVSLGEFVRTMIRANPFKGGTSEFAYPDEGGYDKICEKLSDFIIEKNNQVKLNSSIKKIVIKDNKVKGVLNNQGEFIKADSVVVTYPAYIAVKQLFDENVFDQEFLSKVEKLNKTTSVVETHFCTSEKIDDKQIVFPMSEKYTSKGIFFISNMTDKVSPPGEHLLMAGTPVPSEYTENPEKIKEISKKMREEIAEIYPNFEKSLLWERPMAWKLVEAVVKEPGMVWKQKMPHEIKNIKGLYFVGDSTVSYGIGTDSAAHSSLLCHPKIMKQMETEQENFILN